MDEAKVLGAANDAIDAAKKLNEQAGAAVATNNQIITALGGTASWEKNLHDLREAAVALKEGRSSVPKEVLIEAIAGVNAEMEADRKARGMMVGDRPVSDAVAKACDVWNKDFDYKSFLFATRQADPKLIKQADLLNTAMGAQAKSELHSAFQHAYMRLAIADAIATANAKNKKQTYRGPREDFPQLMAVCDYTRAALYADIVGKAAVDPNDVADTADWLPTVFSPDFRSLLYLELRVESLFNMVPFSGNATTVRMPLNITNSVGHRVPQSGTGAMGTTFALSNPMALSDPIQMGTQILDGKKDFTFDMHRGRTLWQGILDEDSGVPFLSIAEQNIVLEIARASETAIINGQKSGEIDTGSGGVAALTHDPRNSWDGLRKHVRLQTGSTFAAANAALTVTMLMQSGPILGGKYMVNAAQGAIILAPNNFFQIITDTAVWTAEKYGPQATVFNGSLASVGGKPIIISEFVPVNLNASGIFDNVTTDRTVALIVHRPSFMGIERRGIQVGVDYWRATDVYDAVGMRRLDWGKIWGNSEKCVTEITNLKTT